MEEDKIKDIFSSYDPHLTSSLAFMERLERNLNAVELIHKENAAIMKRNRIAVGLASVAGFITGVIFTIFYSYISSLIQSILSSIQTIDLFPDSLYVIQVITWLVIAAMSALISLNTYAISSTLLIHNR